MIRWLAPPESAPRTPESEKPGSPLVLNLNAQIAQELPEELPVFSPTEILDASQTTFITERRHSLKTFDVYYKDGQDLNNEGLLIAHAARRVLCLNFIA